MSLSSAAAGPERTIRLTPRSSANTRFYTSLAYLAVTPLEADDETTKHRLDYIEQTLAQAEIWSQVTDVNLLAYSRLILALSHERQGLMNDAVQGFEAALDHAEVNSQTFEYALVAEHYAEFLIRRKANRLARTVMRDAAASYRRISYLGKESQIMAKHEWLLSGTSSLNVADVGCQTMDAEDHKVSVTKSSFDVPAMAGSNNPAPHLPGQTYPGSVKAEELPTLGLDIVDVSNILQSSQALASTLNIDELLSRMAEIMLSSAGAELAAIVVRGENDEGWVVAAIRKFLWSSTIRVGHTSSMVFACQWPIHA